MAAPPDDGLPPLPEDELETARLVAEAEARLFGGRPSPVCVGRFEIRGRLGAGGLGTVYAAHDPELDRTVALKLLRPGWARAASDEQDRTRVRREARMMARLAHPNVVAVHEVGETRGRVFLAMELVEGETLRAWSTRSHAGDSERDAEREQPTWRRTLEVLRQAGLGLAAAHDAGIVHGDFKPENVLIGRDGRVRVSDFGLARPDRSAASETGDPGGGTPAYMAPEQHGGEPPSMLADQFAFCVAAYQALYGLAPFAGVGEERAVAKTSGRIRTPPAEPHVPGFVFRALARGLQPRPDDRWRNMAAMLAALAEDPRQRAHRKLIGATVALVLGLALIGAVLQLWMFAGWMRQARQRLERAPDADASTPEPSAR